MGLSGMLRPCSGAGQGSGSGIQGHQSSFLFPKDSAATRKVSSPHLGRVFSATYLGPCHYNISLDIHLRPAATHHPSRSPLLILESYPPLHT